MYVYNVRYHSIIRNLLIVQPYKTEGKNTRVRENNQDRNSSDLIGTRIARRCAISLATYLQYCSGSVQPYE